MNNTYNRKAVWSFVFGLATLLLPLTALDLNLLFNYGIWQTKYSTLDGGPWFALQAIVAFVLSLICVYLASNSKKEIRASSQRGVTLARFAFVIGLLGFAYAAINILPAVMLFGAFDIRTTPTPIR